MRTEEEIKTKLENEKAREFMRESKREILGLLEPSQDVPRYDSAGIPIDYTYTPCFGTHGNYGVPIGRCPKCGQLVYEEVRS